MSVDVSDWTARKKLKHSLLRRAFNEGRGSEVILLIQWRLAHERFRNIQGVEAARAFEQDNAGQPRALRSLNLLSAHLGLKTIYKDTVAKIETQPEPSESIFDYLKKTRAEGIFPRAAQQPIFDHLRNLPGRELISRPYTQLQDILHFSDQPQIELPSIKLAGMPVASNDKFVRLNEAEAAKVMKKPDYNDNEDADDAEEYVAAAIADYFYDDPDTTAPQVPDDIEILSRHYAAPKPGIK